MSALVNSLVNLPMTLQQRYAPSYWVRWANALLEYLSGQGTLVSDPVERGVPIHSEIWVDRPPNCRDVIKLTDNREREANYRFTEVNSRLRLLDVKFPKQENDVVFGEDCVVNIFPKGFALANENEPKLADGQFDGHLCVIEGGTASGQGYIVGKSYTETTPAGHEVFIVDLLDTPNLTLTPETVSMIPALVQSSWHLVADDRSIGGVRFVSPRDYLIMRYKMTYEPVVSISDSFAAGVYISLCEAWFNWKAQEQSDALTGETAYWRGRVDEELARLRAEKSNRINKPQGRFLAGFSR